MDNGTLVDAFKFLNYSQLAKNSFVSKRFWNLIRTNRHSLALLYVDEIRMGKNCRTLYNEWVTRNNYSKRIQLENQVAGMQSTECERKIYEIRADAIYKDPKYGRDEDITTAFLATVEFNNENWPACQHLIRLLTDPFIYIRSMKWVLEKEVLSLLSETIRPDRTRLQWEQLVIKIRGNVQNLMNWIKGHVLCTKFLIDGSCPKNCDEELLDFFMTGANCTSEISVKRYHLSKVLIDLAKKFLELKNCDDYKVVESIECYEASRAVKVFNCDYAKFLVKEGYAYDDYKAFEFVNDAIGKKLRLTVIEYW